MKQLTPAQRLVVGADFRPDPKHGQGRNWLRQQIIKLAKDLRDIDCTFKVEVGARAIGYDIASDIRSHGLRVFLDMKLKGIPETLRTDGILLREFRPDIVTVMCDNTIESMKALKAELPETEVLGVTVLTSMDVADVRQIYHSSIISAVANFSVQALHAGLDGIVCSPAEIATVREIIGSEMSINTPNVRLEELKVENDDQNPLRKMTPFDAIVAGADRLIINRPILRAENRRDATLRIIDEIAKAADSIGR